MYGTSMRENREIPPSPRLLITGWAAQGTQGGTPEMHERGKSDRFVVPANPPNKATAAEVGEEREWKGSEPRGTRTVKRIPDPVPEPMRRARWAVCVRWHDGTRTRGSPRCCTMSRRLGSGGRIGRSARRPRRGWTG